MGVSVCSLCEKEERGMVLVGICVCYMKGRDRERDRVYGYVCRL